MKLKNTCRSIVLTSVGMLFTFFATFTQAQSLEGGIIEGKSFENISIGKSTMKDVISTYGKNYQLINHKEYTYEIVYKNLGLSFYTCQSDPSKEIILVEFQSPFKVTTSKGIVLGESTLADVRRIYGDYGERAFSDSDQKGIYFYVETETDPDKAYDPAIYEEGSEELEIHEAKTIKVIELVEESGLRQCDSKFKKVEDK